MGLGWFDISPTCWYVFNVSLGVITVMVGIRIFILLEEVKREIGEIKDSFDV